jgi:hypothetical protein
LRRRIKNALPCELSALELDQALGTIHAADDDDAWSTFVADGEQTMSREHTAWLARRRGP